MEAYRVSEAIHRWRPPPFDPKRLRADAPCDGRLRSGRVKPHRAGATGSDGYSRGGGRDRVTVPGYVGRGTGAAWKAFEDQRGEKFDKSTQVMKNDVVGAR